MTKLTALITASVLLTVGLTSPGIAQETTEPAAETATQSPNPDLSLGETVGEDGVGRTYTREEFGEWQLRCIKTADGKDPCQLYQLVKDDEGNSVAEISMFALPAGQQATAGATIATPLETLLTQQLTLGIDSNTPKRYPFSYCSVQGCFSRIGLTDDDVAAFKKGAAATMQIVPLAAPDTKVNLNISLSGFTAGFAAVQKANAENQN